MLALAWRSFLYMTYNGEWTFGAKCELDTSIEARDPPCTREHCSRRTLSRATPTTVPWTVLPWAADSPRVKVSKSVLAIGFGSPGVTRGQSIRAERLRYVMLRLWHSYGNRQRMALHHLHVCLSGLLLALQL